MPGYQYKPLLGRQIRLLTLHAGSFPDKLQISIRHVDLPAQHSRLEQPIAEREASARTEAKFKYQALSYCWGIQGDWAVSVDGGSGDTSFIRITDNLDSALRHLRAKKYAKTLWVDAICINQANLNERGHQVQLMRDVYQLAARVIIWLGPEKDDSAAAMRYMGFVGTRVEFDWSTVVAKPTSRAHTEDEKALSTGVFPSGIPLQEIWALMQRSWFERVWIRQEVHLAKRAVIYCGPAAIDWHVFRHATMCIIKEMSTFILSSGLHHANILREITSPFKIPVVHLRDALAGTQCSNLRDKVYGMLAVLRPRGDGQDWAIPDYRLPIAEIYTELAKQCIYDYHSMGILASCELETTRLEGLPSWVPDLSTKPAAPLLECPKLAAGLTLAYTKFSNDGILPIASVANGVVDQVSSVDWTELDWLRATSVDNLEKLVETASIISEDDWSHGSYKPDGASIQMAFLRTTLCGDFGDVRSPTQASIASRKQALSFLKFVEMVQLQHLDGLDAIWDDLTVYARTASRMCLGRRFFVTKEGYFGLGPQAMTSDDQIFFFLGCDYPVVLRPLDEYGKCRRYQVVGVCYLDGFMFGEVFYGQIPRPWEIKCIANESTGESSTVFCKGIEMSCIMDESTGEPGLIFINPPVRSRTHPGFRTLKERFSIMGFGIDREGELTPEILQSCGVNVEWIDLV
ncbi:heterokaryon incompatibility protein-domain-containing protein [Xylaria bambusicola]|uniref:heterokaryon incompatibility protein-domain-containing protein n=1 Tax=Xylaria bambusicola TaxID=326684 RepID=UPI0020080926|nr:heterokaryon incompatibility protein-domain-containing protein [Xylaria bambusicola]KAI0515111.1 heterokaryon incompatibility protein-domain-containing protein [Xylaria bambusicola]